MEYKKDEDITENLELILYHLADFEMNGVVKDRALNVTIDIYGDLGKVIK